MRKAMSSQLNYYRTLAGLLKWESYIRSYWATYNDHIISVILGRYLIEVSKPPNIVIRFLYNTMRDQYIIPNILRRIDEEDYDMPR